MHISGIIFAWLVFPAAIAAAYFTARLYETRNAWAERVAAYRTHNEDYRQLVDRKERELRELRAEYERLRSVSGMAWRDVNVTVDRTNGGLAADNLGQQNQGLGTGSPAAATPVVHAFGPRQDGSWVYIGQFEAQPRQLDSTFTPQWPLLPNEANDWANGKWRIRDAIPRDALVQIPAMYIELAKRDERIASKQADVADARRLLADAQNGLNLRKAELVGDPAANPQVEGYVAAIQREQALRDQAEQEVDRLRREIQAAWQKLVRLAAENADLAAGKEGLKPVASAGRPTEAN